MTGPPPAWRALAAGLLLAVGGLAARPQLAIVAGPGAGGPGLAAAGASGGGGAPCLCSFDVERTLVSGQEATGVCPGDRGDAAGVRKAALSEAARDLRATACSGCYLAVVGSGDAGGEGSELRGRLVRLLKGSGGRLLSEEWRACAPGNTSQGSPLVTGCRDGTKQKAVMGVLAWLRSAHSVDISEAHAWHFDDQDLNVLGFHGTGLNARQVSCRSRDARTGGGLGLCGAARGEVVLEAGISRCPDGGGPAGKNPDGEGVEERLSGEADGAHPPALELLEGRSADDGSGAMSLAGPERLGAGGCRQWCAEQRDCECAVLERATGQCWLKRRCRSQAWAAAPGRTVLWKAGTGDGARPDPEHRVSYAHRDVNLADRSQPPLEAQEGVSFEACETWCAQTSGCGCAVYLELRQRCFLRKDCRSVEASGGGNATTPMLLQGGDWLRLSARSWVGGGEVENAVEKRGPARRSAHPRPSAGGRAGSLGEASVLGEQDNDAREATAEDPCDEFRDKDDPGSENLKEAQNNLPETLPEGVSVRVTRALGSRGYNKVRVSLVHFGSEPAEDSGDVKWTYSKKFEHKWTNCYIKSAVVDAKPGGAMSVSLDDQTINIKLPAEGDGVRILLMADPCLHCKGGGHLHVKEMTSELLNGMAAAGELDSWVTVGDNWYDVTGKAHNELWNTFSRATQSLFFGATLGNHDFWIDGHPPGKSYDSYGNGHTQWYGLDSMAAKEDEAKLYDLSKQPGEVVDVSNTFWYNAIGNVVLIGFSNNYAWSSVEEWFKEACSYAGEADAKLVLVMGHWNYAQMGVTEDMTTPKVWERVKELDGCSGTKVKFVLGHTHENNNKQTGQNFMVGAWGYGGGPQDGALGVPIVDTRDDKVIVHYWKLAWAGKKLGSYDETLDCLKTKGVSGCVDLESHETWMEEDI